MAEGFGELNYSDYDYLKTRPVQAWAWEYLRRNPAYIEAWNAHMSQVSSQNSCMDFVENDEMEAAAKFGLLFFR
ncbi:MAG: hypothetical protein OCD03_14700 [Hyphomicrobiales bacterium]